MRTWYAYGRPAQKTAHYGDWYHGSGTQDAFDRFDFDKDREHAEGPKHWNSHLGAHFTSEHTTAARIAYDGSGHVYHAHLAMTTPKHYMSEFDLDREAKSWAENHDDDKYDYDSPHHHPEEWLRNHPRVKEVAAGFKEHLKSQGYDGITYGNEFEGSHLHDCAIAFHPDDITITKRHHSADHCDESTRCEECLYPHDQGAWGECDHCGHEIGQGNEEGWKDLLGTLGSLTGHFASFGNPMGDQDWDEIHPDLPDTVHRGVGVNLPDDLHRFVHDDSKPTHERAKALLGFLHSEEARNPERGRSFTDPRGGVGTSWSTDDGVAENFAEDNADRYTDANQDHASTHEDKTWGHYMESNADGPYPVHVGKPGTAVVLHAHTPERHEIDDDPNGDGSGMRYTYHGHGEREVPVHGGTEMRLKGISWRSILSMEHPDYVSDPETYTRHEFDRPMHAEAMASTSQDHRRAFHRDHPNPTYVRFGDWPEDERSMNHITGWKEEGVSVYDLDKDGNPMDPDHDMDRGQHYDGCGGEEHCELWEHDPDNDEMHDDTAAMLRDHLQDNRRGNNTRPDRRAHLVQGEFAGWGHDDEPVLRNVKKVGHWPCDVHKFVPTAEPREPEWCHHPDHDEDEDDDFEPVTYRKHAEYTPEGVWDPAYKTKETQHAEALHAHLAEHHPHLLDLPERIRDLHHRLEHTSEGQGIGGATTLHLGHDHDPLIEPTVSKSQRVALRPALSAFFALGEQEPQRKRRGIYRFEPEPPPEGLHSYFRGLYLGGDTRGVHVPDPNGGIGSIQSVPADYSDQGILDRLRKHHQWRLDTGQIVGPEHPAHDRRPMFGSHWTEDPKLAHRFAFDAQHGKHRSPRPPTRPTTGVVLEMQSSVPPSVNDINSNFGETEVDWPGRGKVERVLAHVHRYDPEEHGPNFHYADTHVRTFEVPREHLEKHSAKTRKPAFGGGVPHMYRAEQRGRHHLPAWDPKTDDWETRVLPPTHPLMATQDDLDMEKVHDMLDPKMRQFADDDLGGVLPVVVPHEGEDHIWDGHHRLVSDRLAGRPSRVFYYVGDRKKTAAKDDDIEHLIDLIGGNRPPRLPEKTPEEKAAEEAEHQERWRKHEEWQAKRPGVNPGDDLSNGMPSYPHAEWVPIHVAQRFRDHTGDQHSGSEETVADIHRQLASGRGMTDPLMLLHHTESGRARLGEGNHRLVAAERAGWTHVPMRVCRMYDSEAERGDGRSIPVPWRKHLSGRTPEMCRPSEVFQMDRLDAGGTTKDSGVKEARHGAAEGVAHEGRLEGHSGGRPGLDRPPRLPGDARKARRLGRVRELLRVAAGQPARLDVEHHGRVAKDLKGLDKPTQKAASQRIDELATGQTDGHQTHALTGPMKGWLSTKISRGHRVVHRTEGDTLHIGYVGLHDYGEAIRRLTYQQGDRDRNKDGNCFYYPDHDHDHYDVGNGEIECPYSSSHTDWDREYDRLPDTLHRGMQLLKPGEHFHRMADHEKAHAFLDNLTDTAHGQQHAELGSHWSTSEQVAKGYGDPGTMSSERQGVVFHIHKPEREHIVTDPEWLEERASFGMDYHDDAEVPIHSHAPVKVKGVSWLEGGEWKRHDFDEPQHHLAMLGARRTVTEKDGSHYDGIMIAFVPPPKVAKDLALDDGTEAVDNLHITLAYLGDKTEYSKEMLADLPEIIKAWGETQKPMQARTQGAGTFVPAEEDGQHVLWASVDVPGLHRVHTDLVDMLRSNGYQPREDHSFTPHITLSYGKHHWRFLPKIASHSWEVDEVFCCIGGEWQSFPFDDGDDDASEDGRS